MAIANVVYTSGHAVDRSVEKVVTWGLVLRDLDCIEAVGVDEIDIEAKTSNPRNHPSEPEDCRRNSRP